jgi:Bax inhibitor 1
LTGTIGLAALGAVCQIVYHINTGMLGLANFFFILGIYFTSSANFSLRAFLLGTFGFTTGLTMGPLIDAVMQLDASIVPMALGSTAIVFGSFSATALLSRRRSFLYLGGMLSTAIMLLLFMSLFSFIIPSALQYVVQIYGGLVIFCFYVIYDTQMIVEKASLLANPDAVVDSLELFIDFAAIFVRLLIILSQNSQNKKKENNSSRR